MEATALSPEIHHPLETFVGRWTTLGSQYQSPFGPPAEIETRESYEWLQGGEFLIHRVDGRVGDSPTACIEIIVAEGDRHRATTYYNDGNTKQWVLRESDGAWMLSGNWTADDSATEVRCTMEFAADKQTHRARWEWSQDGTTWQTFWNVTSSRA
ncbi:hypothetical protein BH09MYX1_BH09MYX1_53180 [soil metagenome]